MRHFIDSRDITRQEMEALFDHAEKYEKKLESDLEGKIVACLFYEPSTRTRLSFESAALRLGGSVIGTENAKESSSAVKGETLEDSIRVTSKYCDAIVIRHPEAGTAERAAMASSVPVINAGDGIGQHPTQAMLDLYTIKKVRGKIDGLNIAFIGDLKNGRTVKSDLFALSKFKDIKIMLVSPEGLRLQPDILCEIRSAGIEVLEKESVDGHLPQFDIVYQTRIQKERFDDPKKYEIYKGSFVIDKAFAEKMKPGAFIMHPLPRIDEIKTEVDSLPQAKYFEQAKNGLYVRMAILDWLLNHYK